MLPIRKVLSFTKHTLKNIVKSARQHEGQIDWSFITAEEIETGKLKPETINFFHTFGYLVLPGFFKPELQMINKEFDLLMRTKFGRIKWRPYFYPQFIDNSEVLTDNIIGLPKVNNVVDSLLGPKAIYKGSDGAVFTGGSAWHRDYLNINKSMKLLVYLEGNTARTGALRGIPGSHFVKDAYSGFLSKALTWPEPPVGGGFDEKKFLPAGSNPMDPGRRVSHLPNVVLANKPGDLIMFNHNLVHCAGKPLLPKKRRLMAFAFASNLLETQPDHPQSKELMQEMKDVTLVEINCFSLPTAYGSAMMKSTNPFVVERTSFLKDLNATKKGPDMQGRHDENDMDTLDFCRRFNDPDISDFYRLN